MRSLTTRISNNANSKPRGQSTQTYGQAGTELQKARMKGHLLGQAVGDDDGGDQAVNGNNLGHDGAEAVVVQRLLAFLATDRREEICMDNGRHGSSHTVQVSQRGRGDSRILHQPIRADNTRGEDGSG